MNKEEIFKIITTNIKSVMPELKDHKIQLSDNLEVLGANSLDRIDILIMIMEDLNLEIPRIELSVAKTLGELTDILYEKMK